MKFVIVVLAMGVNEQVAIDYFSCVIARNNNVFGVIRKQEDVEDTIKKITENKRLVKRDEKEIPFGGKILTTIMIEVE